MNSVFTATCQANMFGGELGATVRPNVFQCPVLDERVGACDRRATTMVTQRHVNSSIKHIMWDGRAFLSDPVRSHGTRPDWATRRSSRTHDSLLSHGQRLFGCLVDISRPCRCQIRDTLLKFIRQPASLSDWLVGRRLFPGLDAFSLLLTPVQWALAGAVLLDAMSSTSRPFGRTPCQR